MLIACKRAIAGATDPLLARRLAAVDTASAQTPAARRSAGDSGRRATPAPRRATPTRSSSPRPSTAPAAATHVAGAAAVTAACCCASSAAICASSTASRASARASRACTAAGSAAPAQSRTRRPPARPTRARAAHSPTSPASPASDSISRVCSCVNAVRSRLTCRAASSADRRHPHFAPDPPLPATDAHQHPHQFQRIEPIRFRAPRPPIHLDARRIHHPIRDPQLRQRPMNPEPVAPRFVAAHHPRRRPATRTAAAPARITRSTARRSPLATVRSHGATPNPDVIASFHSFLLNSNATYNVGSLTLSLRAGRCSHHSLLLALNTVRSLICAARS